jgi:hypothetical protein
MAAVRVIERNRGLVAVEGPAAAGRLAGPARCSAVAEGLTCPLNKR